MRCRKDRLEAWENVYHSRRLRRSTEGRGACDKQILGPQGKNYGRVRIAGPVSDCFSLGLGANPQQFARAAVEAFPRVEFEPREDDLFQEAAPAVPTHVPVPASRTGDPA